MHVFSAQTVSKTAPSWTYFQPAGAYHAESRSGRMMSSGMLREFRRSPSRYRALTTGLGVRPDTTAFRFGRAVHTLILEGEAAFRACFRIGGPINARTGRTFAVGSKNHNAWLLENGVYAGSILTREEADAARRIRDAVLGLRESAELLREGWPERSAKACLEGVDCQIRMDWLRPDATLVDLKTVRDITRFQADAGRYGYLDQFAFYREVAYAAGAPKPAFFAVAVEKAPPFHAAVREIPAKTLDAFACRNRETLRRYLQCRGENRWPATIEKSRDVDITAFPPL